MIIDTTVSAMEDQMDKMRCLDERVENRFRKPAEHRARAHYRQSSIRSFLIKQGKNFNHSSNYIVFWENGEIQNVHILTEPTKEAKLKEDKKYEVHLQKMLDKFAVFMQFGVLSSQRNQELSE